MNIAFLNAGMPLLHRFNFGTGQHNPGFDFFKNLKIPSRKSVHFSQRR
jgi:hypothetical protein